MTSEPNSETIELRFPASTRFIRLSRLTAATLAAEMGFDVESADDLRIAVDELVTVLVEGDHGKLVTLRFRVEDDRLEVTGACEQPWPEDGEPSDLLEAILAATTDGHEVSAAPRPRSFAFTKYRRSPQPGAPENRGDLA